MLDDAADAAGMSDPATLPVLRGNNAQPLANSPRADACGLRDGLRRLPALDLPYNPLSTARREPGILMGVHSVLRESLRFGNISVPGSGRMDNLLKVHS